jgi:fructosamine-3-kinase
LRWVLEDGGEFSGLPGLNQMTSAQVVELEGGVDSATYLVRGSGREVAVKLKSNGLEAEARALRAWRPYTTRVPEILGFGTVPSMGDRSIKYLVLAALKNDEGRIVETADEFLDRSPASARELGRAVGAELHRMHQAVDATGFGNFADSPGSERTYSSWSGYLEDFFALHAERAPSKALLRDRELLDGFWESYPGGVAEESLLTAQLVQAVLQAEHRTDRLRHGQADPVDVEVTYEFIRAAVHRVAAA